MVGILRALQREHANLATLLDIVEREVNGDPGPDYSLIRGILDYCLTYPDQYHHPKEDLVYRAMCRHDPALSAAIGDLEAEHEELAIATREVSEALDRVLADEAAAHPWFDDMARAFIETYRTHMAKEERDFFPEALRALRADEWAEVEAQITDPTDPFFHEKGVERLAALEDRLRSYRVAI